MDNIEIIGICKLLEIIFPGYWDKLNFMKYDYKETSLAVDKWCKENNAHYYARGRENFYEWEACKEAAELGKTKVVVEDLS